jgi:hypothetical protein
MAASSEANPVGIHQPVEDQPQQQGEQSKAAVRGSEGEPDSAGGRDTCESDECGEAGQQQACCGDEAEDEEG